MGVLLEVTVPVSVAVGGTDGGAEQALITRRNSSNVARRMFLFYCGHLKNAHGFSATNYANYREIFKTFVEFAAERDHPKLR